jgi:hypothetical protein
MTRASRKDANGAAHAAFKSDVISDRRQLEAGLALVI